MKIGVPQEIKANENRIALTPAGASVLSSDGHQVFIERGAGEGSGFSDAEYTEVGAEILEDAEAIYGTADMIMKVKEPLEPEFDLLRTNQILFTYLHLAAEEDLTRVLMDRAVVSIAYETVELEDGSLPLLTPMSEVAGRMATQVGIHHLEEHAGGKGKLMGGIPGVLPGRFVVVGGGVVGTNAAKMAVGLGADVTILDIDADRLRYLEDVFGNTIKTRVSNPFVIAEEAEKADLLVGAVLVPGARCPTLVTDDMIRSMEDGSVVVDVAIDQGGSIETIDRVTTHAEPTYVKHGVVHYSVANMPGAVPRTSTIGLTNVTLPYACEIAAKGWKKAVQDDPALAKGVNVLDGKIVYGAVAEAFDLPYHALDSVL